MTVTYGPFSSGAGASVSDTIWGEMAKAFLGTGVLKGVAISGGAGGDLAVTAGAALSINIATGQAMVYGRWVQNDASFNIVLSAADPTNPRIDYIVCKMDNTSKTVSFVAKTGTPAASPVAPTLTQTSTTWELGLYTVAVPAAATVPGAITDQRTYARATFVSGAGSGLDADTVDGLNSTAFVQVGSGNQAATPVRLLVVGSTGALPAAGTKGRVAIVTGFSLP